MARVGRRSLRMAQSVMLPPHLDADPYPYSYFGLRGPDSAHLTPLEWCGLLVRNRKTR